MFDGNCNSECKLRNVAHIIWVNLIDEIHRRSGCLSLPLLGVGPFIFLTACHTTHNTLSSLQTTLWLYWQHSERKVTNCLETVVLNSYHTIQLNRMSQDSTFPEAHQRVSCKLKSLANSTYVWPPQDCHSAFFFSKLEIASKCKRVVASTTFWLAYSGPAYVSLILFASTDILKDKLK